MLHLDSTGGSANWSADSLRSLAAMIVWLNVTVTWLTSLLFGTKDGLAVGERWEVRVPGRGAWCAPRGRSVRHRVADPCVA
jgi:hypothetical protein